MGAYKFMYSKYPHKHMCVRQLIVLMCLCTHQLICDHTTDQVRCYAGNSSQVSDGAAAVVVTTRGEAARRGLPVLGVLRSFAVVGCPPDIMGIGPAVAIPEALKKAGKIRVMIWPYLRR